MSETSSHPPELQDLSPSCKFVHYVLEDFDQLSQSELRAETGLPQRTVRYALKRLCAADLIERSYSTTDARTHLYETVQNSRGESDV